ncbi:MAG: mannose-6-phosphate isomerase [Flavobacteriia bacterium]|nr:MAG: mannose-6-phosphate isomerase [Flavobacteriia bacterium]
MKPNYPLKFKPILKEKIWGGEKLKNVLNKKTDKSNVGESWEISDVQGDTSIVSNGALEGKSLSELIVEFKEELVGEKVYRQFKNKFPLLIKFIDAAQPLSIQLHPNDKLAKERHNSFGKAEMWYIMQADPGSGLIVGFKKEVSKAEYLENLKNKTLTEILNFEPVKEGDVYFIPTGRVHAIKEGVLLAEIQQTSDITYRIYDWDRVDDQGNSRELHTELALDAIDYKVQDSYKTSYTKKLNNTVNIVDCQYFNTNIISFDKEVKIDYSNKDSFIIYMCVKGSAQILFNEANSEKISKGETLLIPASLKELTLKPDGYTEILEIYIS